MGWWKDGGPGWRESGGKGVARGRERERGGRAREEEQHDELQRTMIHQDAHRHPFSPGHLPSIRHHLHLHHLRTTPSRQSSSYYCTTPYHTTLPSALTAIRIQ